MYPGWEVLEGGLELGGGMFDIVRRINKSNARSGKKGKKKGPETFLNRVCKYVHGSASYS